MRSTSQPVSAEWQRDVSLRRFRPSAPLHGRTFGARACAAAAFVGIGALGIACAAGAAERGPKILETVLERYADSVADIDNYTVTQQVMGTPSTAYFEKKKIDGRATFVPVSALTLMQERIDAQRSSFGQAALRAGLSALAPEANAASYQKMGNFVGSLEKLGAAQLGRAGGIGDSPLEAVRHVLVQSAAQAGLQEAAKRLGLAPVGQLKTLAGALTELDGKGILGQLGKVALGQVKRLALDSFTQAVGGPLGGAAAGALQSAAGGRGVAGALGGGSGGGFAVLGGGGAPGGALGGVGGVGQQAVGGLVQAGMGALMGGLGAVVSRAMTPDLSQLDRAAGGTITPDVHELMRSIGENVRLADSSKIDGHKIWNLEVRDVSRLELANADGFTPKDVTLGIDRNLYVLRSAAVSGEVRANGKTVPVTMETRLDDYRNIDGLLYPFHTVTTVRGMSATLSAKERRQAAQMPADVEGKMKEALKQLEKLPPQQRAMAEAMLKQQMPQLEQMMKQTAALASSDGTEITVDVQDVAVNQGRPASLQTWGSSP